MPTVSPTEERYGSPTLDIWTEGTPEHALAHLSQGSAFDCRIAMISIDNGVELAIKTFLQLPKRVRGSEGPSRKQFEEKSRSFSDLMDLLEQFAGDRLDGVSLGDLEGYHRLRNALYHDGNGVTVDPVHVDSYLQVSRIVLKNLLSVSVDEPDMPPPHSLLGQLVLRWAEFEQLLRQLADSHLPRPKRALGPALSTVDGLVSKGLIPGPFRSRVANVAKARNAFVHGVSVPTSAQLRPIIGELEKLLATLREIGNQAAD